MDSKMTIEYAHNIKIMWEYTNIISKYIRYMEIRKKNDGGDHCIYVVHDIQINSKRLRTCEQTIMY